MTFQPTSRKILLALGAAGMLAIAGFSNASFAQSSQTSSGKAPKASSTTMPATAHAPAASQAGSVIEVATGAGQFTTLVAAIQAAGLTQTLSGAGPFTVFAPSDAAFAKLPAGTVENLLMPENKAKLASILTYHVVPGRIASSALSGVTTTPPTVQGGTLGVDTSLGVKVGGAVVTTPDIAASNGVIHVIDTVLMPPTN